MNEAVYIAYEGGINHFWQWDKGQKLLVSGVDEIQIERPGEESTLNIAVVDGVANVPDECLQRAGRLVAYASAGDSTLGRFAFQVLGRQKPADYIATETEKETWAKLAERIAAVEARKTDEWELIDQGDANAPSITVTAPAPLRKLFIVLKTTDSGNEHELYPDVNYVRRRVWITTPEGAKKPLSFELASAKGHGEPGDMDYRILNSKVLVECTDLFALAWYWHGLGSIESYGSEIMGSTSTYDATFNVGYISEIEIVTTVRDGVTNETTGTYEVYGVRM